MQRELKICTLRYTIWIRLNRRIRTPGTHFTQEIDALVPALPSLLTHLREPAVISDSKELDTNQEKSDESCNLRKG